MHLVYTHGELLNSIRTFYADRNGSLYSYLQGTPIPCGIIHSLELAQRRSELL